MDSSYDYFDALIEGEINAGRLVLAPNDDSDLEVEEITSTVPEHGSPNYEPDSDDELTDIEQASGSSSGTILRRSERIRVINIRELQPLSLEQAQNIIINHTIPDEYYHYQTDTEDEDDDDEQRRGYTPLRGFSPNLLPEFNYELTPNASPIPPEEALVQVLAIQPPPNNGYVSKCTVCIDRAPSVLFFGCQHISCCGICIRGLQIVARGGLTKCPFCNLPSSYILGRLP